MKEMKEMKGINKAAMIIAKILEVFHWAGSAVMAVMFIVALVSKDRLNSMVVQNSSDDTRINTYGFDVEIIKNNGFDVTAVAIYAIVSLTVMALMAMVFRNIHLIIKTAEGKTTFSKGKTPFQKDVVRMIREIGIFLISISAVQIIGGIVMSLAVRGSDVTVSAESVIFGIMLLCLSTYFDYGTKLEQDVDGLL